MPDVLIEIGTEEIPASYLEPAAGGIGGALHRALADARIPASKPTVGWTPRRISIHFAGVAERGESRTERRTGPAAKIAYDADGNPTRAAIGFARSAGVDPGALEVVETDKGPYVTAVVTDEGESLADVLSRALPAALASAAFPKTMRWTGSPATFARPIRRLVVLAGDEVVPVEAAGLVAGRSTTGHPFLAPSPFDLDSADLDAYREGLRERMVRVDAKERKAEILSGLGRYDGGERSAADRPGLVDEVANLTEWPVVLEGRMDPSFLELPVEVLEVSMRVHLRFFPVLDAKGRPRDRFLAVMNRTEESAGIVREGNERVLAARLTDARFFFGEDRKRTLESRVETLGDKALHRELGSYLDKAERLVALSGWIADALGLGDAKDHARRAARLAKADLVTEMVGEFPELQGVMGRIYATLDGEAPEVAEAIEDHYRPRGPDDELPRGDAAVAVALAEKLDNLAAFFSIGGAPTGSSDPFGLRRQALGLLRIATDKGVALPLSRALAKAAELLGAEEPESLREQIVAYVRDRVYQAFTDEGFRYDLVRAALATGFDDLCDLRERVIALTGMAEEEWWPELVEVVERTGNIIRGAAVRSDVDPDRLAEAEERELHAALATGGPAVEERLSARDYRGAARTFLEHFGESVHRFFASVYVNVDDLDLRANRIALVGRVNELFAARVADLARVEKAGGERAG